MILQDYIVLGLVFAGFVFIVSSIIRLVQEEIEYKKWRNRDE